MSQKEKKEMFCKVRGLESKEPGDGEFHVNGLIATSHIDSINDMIPKMTLDKWARDINSGKSTHNKVSYHHKREPQVVGTGQDDAEVIRLPDGEWGLRATTKVNRTHEVFDDLVYEVSEGHVDGFSIEFDTHGGDTTHTQYIDGEPIRVLGPETELGGWGFASRAIQPEAAIADFGFKELLNKKNKEGFPMESKEEKAEAEAKAKAEAEAKIKAEAKAKKEVEVKEKAILEAKEKAELEAKKNGNRTSAEKILETKEFKEWKEAKENKAFDVKMEKAMKELLVKEKVLQEKDPTQSGAGKEKSLEVKEFEEVIIGKKKLSVKEQFKRASNLAEKYDLWDKETSRAESREYKSFMLGENDKLEYKALGIDTNSTSYSQSSTELQDLYDPVIYNALNQQTTTWSIIAKDDMSMKGNNLIQFKLKTVANQTAAYYKGNAVNTGNVTRLKYQTKFKKAQVGISIDGDMIAAARGGPMGDIFAKEVEDSTDDLMSVMNAALYAEVGLETAAGIIGFEYIADSAGNTTLYGQTRSAANKLAPDSAGDTYIDGGSVVVSMTNLRACARQAKLEGSKRGNLVFFTSPTQGDMYRGKWDDSIRHAPRDTIFGFATDLFVDGIPVFEDKDCNTDDWFLVDLDSHRIGMWIPPTIEKLGKSADADDAFVKTYHGTYNRRPRALCQIHSNATS